MSASIPGHGYHPAVAITPRCTCGWHGGVTNSDGAAHDQYEAHKAKHREPAKRAERHLTVVG